MDRSVAAGVALLAATLCGCSPKGASTSDSAKVAQAGATAASAPRGMFDGGSRIAVVHARDFAFESPDTITSGWTTFHLVNDGQALHHLQIVRLDSGKTANDLVAALHNPGPPPSWAVFVGGPNAPDPHGQVDGMIDLAPGNYVLVCMVDMPGGIPHIAKGMHRAMTVIPATGNAGAEPVADATISLADYAFTINGAMTPGAHVIKVINTGPQPHEVEMVKLAPGKTATDMLAWIAKPDGPPPGNALGGVAAEAAGSPNYFKAELSAGKYALLCFLPDTKDGKPHFMHGMIKEFTVE
jgi:hypothetical protein